MTVQQGDRIGPYIIEEPLGQGGMAAVYKARHERLGRFVAIKMMHATFLSDDSFLSRFEREAQIVASLSHQHIVEVYDYAEHEGTPYLVMRHVDGMTLKRYAMKRGVTPQEAADLLAPIADALDYAHQHGVLHRDVKPSNILIDQHGKPYITDFGLARMVDTGASTISHDMMLGTPYYVSPEQAQGRRDLDNRTDIYSLAVVLYELVTGSVPFVADTPYAIVHGHIYSQPDAPSQRNPALTAAVDQVLLKALAKEPQQRYATASEMIAAFRDALENDSPQEAESVPKAVQSQMTPPPVIEAPKRTDEGRSRVHLEGSLDMGRLDFGEIGQSLGTGLRNLSSMIQQRVEEELSLRESAMDDMRSEEARIRKRVEKRIKARQELAQHITAYLLVNTGLVLIWFFTSRGFPWPLFPIIFWGIGVFAQAQEYYHKYGGGWRKNQEEIEREVRRELERSNVQLHKRKGKNDEAIRLEDLQEGDSVRINDEGELTDSFIEQQRRH